MDYKERLKELRQDNDLSQSELAEYLHCSQTAYGKWENGKRDITINTLIKLAEYYCVSLDYIAGLTKDPTQNWTTKNKRKPKPKKQESKQTSEQETTTSINAKNINNINNNNGKITIK